MRKLSVIVMALLMCIVLALALTYEDEEIDAGIDSIKPQVEVSTQSSLTAGAGSYIKEYVQVNLAEPTEEPDITPESYIYNDPLNQKYPYNVMSADWGSEVYEEGFTYYNIPEKCVEDGGEFPEVVQVYLWEMCKEKDLDYYLILALIERESGYRYDCLGDDGNSLGYMQIYEKYHVESMNKEGVTDLFDTYGNIRVGTSFLQELYEKYGSSGDHCVLMVYNMGAGGASRCWKKGIYSSEYSRAIVKRAQEIEQELKQD